MRTSKSREKIVIDWIEKYNFDEDVELELIITSEPESDGEEEMADAPHEEEKEENLVNLASK